MLTYCVYKHKLCVYYGNKKDDFGSALQQVRLNLFTFVVSVNEF